MIDFPSFLLGVLATYLCTGVVFTGNLVKFMGWPRGVVGWLWFSATIVLWPMTIDFDRFEED